ncbi:MAG: hypothetical protein K2Z81_20695, partial [Cyanobacteria bacterium]|nr:hypothetical protein [Cyanobacteriota bacterium]
MRARFGFALVGIILTTTGYSNCLFDARAAEEKTEKVEVGKSEEVPRVIEPGPLLEMRQQLWGQILEAKKRGAGVSNYITAFDSLEIEVKAGADEAKVKQKLMSIATSLHQQMRSSIAFKQAALYKKVSDAGNKAGSSGSG